MQNKTEQLQRYKHWAEVYIVLQVVTFSLLHALMLPRIKDTATLDLVAFIEGAIAGVTLLLIILLLRYRSAFKDELALTKFHNNLFDERRALIRQKAGFPTLVIVGVIVTVVGAVAAYLDRTVSLTLMAAGIFVLLFHLIAKAWFASKI